MTREKALYDSFLNPLISKPERPLPGSIAIIGSGTIGPDIGYYIKSAMPGANLYLVDVDEKPLEKARARISAYAKKAVDRKKMKSERAEEVVKSVYYTTDYQDIADCDLVIEAATENIPLKQKIFQRVESIVKKEAIITSNTSSIPADRLFLKMERPERSTVTHFFAPAWRSLPVEVISWDGVSKETLNYLTWFFTHTGKAPIITDNAICFMLDRIFDNWCNEAAFLLDEATAGQIDKAVEEFVFAGPFFVLNMANGNPIIIETNTLQMEEGECYRPAKILGSVDKWLTGRPGAKMDIPNGLSSAIRDRLLGILFSQSFDIIDRGIGTREDLNFGCQVALGFKKGPLDIMDDLGEEETNLIMETFEKERPGFPRATKPIAEYTRFNRFILVDDVEDVKIITIRRPQAMNAISDDVNNEILGVLKKYSDDPKVAGFVLTGYGRNAFSAGADIGKFPGMLGDMEASVNYPRECARVQRFMDGMKKPMVAAINGMALGGGLELAIRCHEMVAMEGAFLQFPEVTLGISPGIGGCVVPYRKWPKGSAVFHDMICLGKKITVEKAVEMGMVKALATDYSQMIQLAIRQVKSIEATPIPEGRVDIPDIILPETPMNGKLPLSKQAVAIIAGAICRAAKATTLALALEEGYKGFGETACAPAAREGISAFMERRKPVFKE